MQLEPLSRRRFLKLGIAVGVGVAAIAAFRSSIFKQKNHLAATPYGNLLVLDAAQATTFYAYAEAVLPNAKGFPTALQANLIQRLDEELYFVAPAIRSDAKLVIDALEWLPMVYGYFSRFSTLSNDQRLAFVNATKATRNHTIRAVMNNCRLLCFNLYYGDQSSWLAIGYDGPFSHTPEKLSEQRQHYAQATQKSSQGERQ